MKEQLSCGFIIRDNKTKLFLGCHPYGRQDNLCDIPKGAMNENETYLETALRELNEETGLSQENFTSEVKDLGRVAYNKYKDLYLFYVEANVDLNNLHCDSTFELYGKTVPEMKGYNLGETNMYFPNMKKAIDSVL